MSLLFNYILIFIGRLLFLNLISTFFFQYFLDHDFITMDIVTLLDQIPQYSKIIHDLSKSSSSSSSSSSLSLLFIEFI
jgi:hypothetical protein